MTKGSKKLITITAVTIILLNVFCFLKVSAIEKSKNTTFTLDITDYLTLTVDDSDGIVHVTPEETFSSGTIVAGVATNNGAGYTVTMQDADSRNGLERNGYRLVSEEDRPKYVINSVSSDTAFSSLEEDTWGYYIGSASAEEATFKRIPFVPTSVAFSDEQTAALESTIINFGVKVSPTRPSGTYADTIIINAIANMSGFSLEQSYAAANKNKVTINNDEYYTMQDMSPDICENATMVNSELQVADVRDNKIYWITKLADDHCWMTQNLDFDIPTTTLSSETTDLTQYGIGGYTSSKGYSKNGNTIYWTPSRGTIPYSSVASGSFSEWQRNQTEPYSMDTGDWYWIGNWNNDGVSTWYEESYSGEYYEGEDEMFSLTPFSGNGTHGHVGNHYNWSASIASNDTSSYKNSTFDGKIKENPQNSICPAGWRLPTISSASNKPGSTDEFNRLFSLYKKGGKGDYALTAYPLWFVRSGEIWKKPGYGGWEGHIQSSTVWSSGWSYVFGFRSDMVETHADDDRGNGYAVRCVARNGKEGKEEPEPEPEPTPETDPVTFDEAFSDEGKTKESTTNLFRMQDITSDICSNVSIGQESQLVDVRDNKVYWVLKAADKKCWMTQNLDLDLDSSHSLIHETSDIGWGTDTFTTSWTPSRSTLHEDEIESWEDDYTGPESLDIGDKYWSWTSDDPYYYDEDDAFSDVPFARNGTHGHLGNYYNWSAVIANNDTSVYDTITYNVPSSNPQNSICPAGWRLPSGQAESPTWYHYEYDEIQKLYDAYDASSRSDDELLIISPLWLVRSGYTSYGYISNQGESGYYWTSGSISSEYGVGYMFGYSDNYSGWDTEKSYGVSVRCVAR